MKTIIFLISIISFNTWASEYYKCYSVQGINPSDDVVMKIATGLFSGKITSVDLVTVVKGDLKEANNPFITLSASGYDVFPSAVSEASSMNFKSIEKTDSSGATISLSDSILKFQKTGYAYYYAKSCFWILDCHSTSYYFKCDKI